NLKLGKRSCILLSGGNIDLNLVAQIVDRGLSQSGRVARLTLVVPDKPGQLNKITQIVAQQGANILEVEHDRLDSDLHIRETAIRLSLETKSREHIEEIKSALISCGFSFKK
ncbi:MAG: ACT domain-containing protein, partial [Bdellovibrionota bacterium]